MAVGDISKFIEEQAGSSNQEEKREARAKVERATLTNVGSARLDELVPVIAKIRETLSKEEAMLVARKFVNQVRRSYTSASDNKKKRLQDKIAKLQKQLETL